MGAHIMLSSTLDRRALLRGAALTGSSLALSGAIPAWAMSGTMGMSKTGKAQPTGVVSGEHIALSVGHVPFAVGGRSGHAITVNGSLPGPLIRLKEGQNVRLDVTNNLAEDTSIHWHGILLPFQYDGVPGISFPGIKPGQTLQHARPRTAH